MPFPTHRPRRLRRTEVLRTLVRETTLSVHSMIYPLFVCPGTKVKDEISSMPGNYRWSVDLLVEECRAAAGMGIPGVILFGIPESKDEVGSGAYATDGIVQRAVRAVKEGVPDLTVICDVCLDEYTSHGHCGLVKNGEIENDSTLELLAKTALTQTEAGADIVTFHPDASAHPHRVLQEMGGMENANDAARGLIRGAALNPGTPLEVLEPLLDELEMVLLLAVNPGWGGQKFAPSTFDRIDKVKEMIGKSGREILLCVDGGITRNNIAKVARTGADIIVAGSAVFDGKSPRENARFMLSAVEAAKAELRDSNKRSTRER